MDITLPKEAAIPITEYFQSVMRILRRSTQAAEGSGFEHQQVGSPGAGVQIPPPPFPALFCFYNQIVRDKRRKYKRRKYKKRILRRYCHTGPGIRFFCPHGLFISFFACWHYSICKIFSICLPQEKNLCTCGNRTLQVLFLIQSQRFLSELKLN